MKRKRYFYSTLRYMHDIASREFFVVGVAVFSPNPRFLRFEFRRTLGLAGEIINRKQLEDFRRLMRVMQDRAGAVQEEQLMCLLDVGKAESLDDILVRLLPKDDSALQWASVQNGFATDLDATTQRLFSRYCEKYDRRPQRKRVTDKDAWRKFATKLRDRRLDTYFTEKRIEGKLDHVKFPFAWKNGEWHCIEPLSFDLADEDAIRNKAHRHIGEITTISDAQEDFALYYIATPPSDDQLKDSFARAMRMLQAAPHRKLEVLSEESEQNAFLDNITKQIAESEGGSLS